MLQQSQTNTINRDQYNGWSNKETWLINLWINNDPYLVECLQDIVSYDDGIYAKVQMLKELVEYTAFGFNNQPFKFFPSAFLNKTLSMVKFCTIVSVPFFINDG